jgi:hypothetical protein
MKANIKAENVDSLSILTTGDIVIDQQIYEGDRMYPAQPGNIAARLNQSLGGAHQLHELIKTCVGKGEAVFGLENISIGSLPQEMSVFTYWKSCPGGLRKEANEAASDSKPKNVWRVEKSLGYGLRSPDAYNLKKNEKSDEPHSVVVIDDADLGFRSFQGRSAWPMVVDPAEEQHGWIVLKMSRPLAEGELWRALTTVTTVSEDPSNRIRKNLVIVISADELRRAGAAISRGFGWERTLSELCRELDSHPRLQALLRHARHLVVNFGCVASAWFGDADPTGSRKAATPAHDRVRLVYDPTLAEGGWKTHLVDAEHSVYGVLNASTAAIAVHLHEQAKIDPKNTNVDLVPALEKGLTAIRQLRRSGHGPVSSDQPGFPFEAIASIINAPEGQNQPRDCKLLAPVAYRCCQPRDAVLNPRWTLAALSENPPEDQHLPLYGLAHRVALYGTPALLHVPHACFGELTSMDRAEIEALRSLSRMMLAYEKDSKGKQPLCLAAFGPPGAGKSFGIKQIAREVLGDKVPILEFNLSQYNDSSELIGAFHQVRDKRLQGATPVVFWDEFDSRSYEWLQYLLAPMQDGTFQENGHTHTLGKCIFVFAGGTSWDFEHFGPAPMPHAEDTEALTALKKRYKNDAELEKLEALANQEFRRKKGPDFISRLDGHINVLGPNPRLLYDWCERAWSIPDPQDITFPVRRSLLLRVFLGARKPKDQLGIDRDLLRAFLLVPRYRHGARSVEKVARPLAESNTRPPFRKAHLPPPQVLDQHLDTSEVFNRVYHQNRAFLTEENVIRIAAAIDENYSRMSDRQAAEKAKLEKQKHVPRKPLTEQAFVAAFRSRFGSKDAWDHWLIATNCAAAQRLPEILSLAGLQLEQGTMTADERDVITQHIQRHLTVLAKEEHDLWLQFHLENNWRQADEKKLKALAKLKQSDRAAYNAAIKDLKKNQRVHTLLTPFNMLDDHEKEKDHDAIRNYPDTVALVGWKIVFLK